MSEYEAAIEKHHQQHTLKLISTILNEIEVVIQNHKDDLIKSGDGIEDLPIEKIIEDIEETLENEL